MRTLIALALAAALLSPAAAAETAAPTLPFDWPVVGHNGAWTIQAGTNGITNGIICAMSTTAVVNGANYWLYLLANRSGRDSATIATDAPDVSLPTGVLGIITDKRTEQTLFIKQITPSAGLARRGLTGGGAWLDTPESFRLFSITAADVLSGGATHVVKVQLGLLSFEVDIAGALTAYQNIQSCAGSGR